MNSTIGIIEEVFGSPGRIAVLRLLANSSVSLTGRQVAELAKLTPAGAARVLDRLASLSVVRRRRVGRAVLHELERDSDLVQTIVLPVFEAEAELQTRLERDLAETFGPESISVVLFGSVARREAEPGSDIDVLVVAHSDAEAEGLEHVAAEESGRYFRTYGKPLSVIVKTQRQLQGRKPAFVREAITDGIQVAGRALKEVVGGSQR
ncbi:MAG: nucleotidyltransferase domain-containing protein [Coriobacteriia bacterium]|nr:nucleotidyltransferase domain-containing protein [Coriobacteriia bacterium]